MSKPTIAAKEPAVIELSPGTYYWCRCGKSAKQPFCDGAHNGTDFEPLELNIIEKQQVALYQCKHTANQPFCDGSHKDL